MLASDVSSVELSDDDDGAAHPAECAPESGQHRSGVSGAIRRKKTRRSKKKGKLKATTLKTPVEAAAAAQGWRVVMDEIKHGGWETRGERAKVLAQMDDDERCDDIPTEWCPSTSSAAARNSSDPTNPRTHSAPSLAIVRRACS